MKAGGTFQPEEVKNEFLNFNLMITCTIYVHKHL